MQAKQGNRKMLKNIVLIAMIVGVSACGNTRKNSSKNVEFDGVKFAVKLSKGEDREDFSIVVREPSKTLAGAREAGRYAATKYCIKNYGTSDVIWANGPDDADEALLIDNDTLSLVGRCKGW